MYFRFIDMTDGNNMILQIFNSIGFHLFFGGGGGEGEVSHLRGGMELSFSLIKH